MTRSTTSKSTSIGECRMCRSSFSKATMTNHLGRCLQQFNERSKDEKSPSFHLIVSHPPAYWLHLMARFDASLEALDQFLRQLWLECCGHMSAFRMGKGYSSPKYTFPKQGRSKAVTLKEILRPGLLFYHEYDFGSTTELDIKVAGIHPIIWQEPVTLLVRNDPPQIPCTVCGKPANKICQECLCQGDGALCAKCASQHECGDEMLMPLVNSPRAGVCGYTG